MKEVELMIERMIEDVIFKKHTETEFKALCDELVETAYKHNIDLFSTNLLGDMKLSG
jgi:hypothetical protein